MTLEKAIEILTQHQKGTDPLYLPGLPEAEKLSIEALKRCQYFDRCDFKGKKFLLPGETEDLAR